MNPESSRDILQNKRWRSITYNWEVLAQYGNEARLYCLTDFQAAWLLSNTDYMGWGTRWSNCPCTPGDLARMKAELEDNLMTCLDFQPYQMQTLYNDAQNGQLTRYNDLWNGSDPSSVNPNAPDDFFDGDGSTDREDALCTALTLWTYSYAVDWSTKAAILLGVGTAIAGIVDAMIPVGGNIAVEAIKDLVNPLAEQVQAMNTINALDTVICDWRAALEGVAINASNWTNAVQGLTYTTATNEWYIQQLLSSDTQLLSNFLSFVNSLGKGYEYAQIGASICACGCNEVTEMWDFTIDDYNSVWDVRPTISGMAYVGGVGWTGVNPGGVQLITDRYAKITEVIMVSSGSGGGAERQRIFDYIPSTNTITGLISNLPFTGDYNMQDFLLAVADRTSGTYTETIVSIEVTGCLA